VWTSNLLPVKKRNFSLGEIDFLIVSSQTPLIGTWGEMNTIKSNRDQTAYREGRIKILCDEKVARMARIKMMKYISN
jgi:hypothetical protein